MLADGFYARLSLSIQLAMPWVTYCILRFHAHGVCNGTAGCLFWGPGVARLYCKFAKPTLQDAANCLKHEWSTYYSNQHTNVFT